MPRRQPGPRVVRAVRAVAFVAVLAALALISWRLSRPSPRPLGAAEVREDAALTAGPEEQCCRGVVGLELWGDAVKWGTDHRLRTAAECCDACKAMCRPPADGGCRCNSWVFCGDKERCGKQFGECWLKKQKDVMHPWVAASGQHVMWTSGLVFGEQQGIIGLHTHLGTLKVRLHSDCAPQSVAYVLDLMQSRNCAGCRIYRAESRGNSWNAAGDHIDHASFGPPYALIQGILESGSDTFKQIPTEAHQKIKRGSVAWVGSGPEFFISLANHVEWNNTYTVFGSVLPEDVEVADNIASLPTKDDVWNGIPVRVLETPVHLKIKSA